MNFEFLFMENRCGEDINLQSDRVCVGRESEFRSTGPSLSDNGSHSDRKGVDLRWPAIGIRGFDDEQRFSLELSLGSRRSFASIYRS